MLVAKVRVKVLSTYVASSTRRFLNVYEDLKQSCRIQQHQCPLSRTSSLSLYQSPATLLHRSISSAHALPPINPTPHTFLFGLHTACTMLATSHTTHPICSIRVSKTSSCDNDPSARSIPKGGTRTPTYLAASVGREEGPQQHSLT